ncbi:MAG: RdgB/HAM1 family non-canonical purine NTP pyrophosphatase [Clostridia bacterium]|nr:RdgB/HAM1 family non-canonical purine NTP pyrophosphatase [Clostridia bacterium]
MDFVLSPNDEISSEQYEESDDYKSDEDLQDEAVNEDDNKQNVFVLASGNAHKLEEFRRVLEPLGITLLSKDDVNAADFDPEETADTFAGNAQIKAEEMAKLTNLPSIADDSGLMIDALNGEPGVYSARYAGENATDEDKCNLILDKLQGLPKRKRKARFVSSICCVFPKTDKIITAEGTCEGRIAFDIRGNNGFGYDPIFIPKKRWDRKTFAEISGNEKDKISHRGNSLREFAYKLSQTLQEDSYD